MSKMNPFAKESRKGLEKIIIIDRIVIREFYRELTELGIMPEGVFTWDKESARNLARGILEKARKGKKYASES